MGSCECAHSRSHDRLRRVSKKTGTQMTTRRSEVDRQKLGFWQCPISRWAQPVDAESFSNRRKPAWEESR